MSAKFFPLEISLPYIFLGSMGFFLYNQIRRKKSILAVPGLKSQIEFEIDTLYCMKSE